MACRGPGLVLAVFLAGVVQCSGGSGGDGPAAPVPDTSVREVEPNDVPGQALALSGAFPFDVEGSVAAVGDLDHFRFDVPSGGRIGLRLTVPAGADYDLALLDGEGRRLATALSDNTDPAVGAAERLYLFVPGPGACVAAVIGHAGPAASYALRIDFAPAPALPGAGAAATGGLARGRCFHGIAALPAGGAIVGGGTTNATSQSAALLNALSSTEVFDPLTAAFEDGPSLGSARFGCTATALADGRVLFAGGDLGATASLYDPVRRAMSRVDLPLAGGNRFLHTATLLPDGRVLLAGGVRVVLDLPPRAENLATTALFDPKSLAFTAGPPMRAARLSHAACLLRDGRVLVSGGVGRSDTEILDPVAGSSVEGPPMATVRDDHAATTLADGRVLVTGGQGSNAASLDSAEILDDPSAGPGSAFRALASTMSDSRSDHEAVLLADGTVLVLGGEKDPGNDRDEILGSVDRFLPAEERFAASPPLVVPRDDARSLLLPDGRVLLTGGEDDAGRGVAACELYVPPPR